MPQFFRKLTWAHLILPHKSCGVERAALEEPVLSFSSPGHIQGDMACSAAVSWAWPEDYSQCLHTFICFPSNASGA